MTWHRASRSPPARFLRWPSSSRRTWSTCRCCKRSKPAASWISSSSPEGVQSPRSPDRRDVMATEIREATQAQPLPDWEQLDHYEDWQRREGAPLITGFYIEDLKELELGAWERKGGKGAFVNLEGTGGVNDAHVIEIAPGGKSAPERHLYEEMTYVLTGRGATTVWYDDGQKQTFEWGRGSLFAVPINAMYQHFNGSGSEPARYVSVTNAPTVLRMFHNDDFVFNNPFKFSDRFAGSDGYFSGEGKLFKKRWRHVWTTNFVPDVHSMELHTWAQRGGGGSNVMLELADNSMG